MTFLAFQEDLPVATVALWENDLASRPDLTPYLATLFVMPRHRRMGIGKKLVHHTVHIAKNIGYANLYLIAAPYNEKYYEHLGWTFVSNETTPHGEATKVYTFDLTH